MLTGQSTRRDTRGPPLSQAAGPVPSAEAPLMVGPLFYHEMLLGSRRSRDHIFRWVYGGWLILQVMWLAFFD